MDFIDKYLTRLSLPKVGVTDLVEIAILAVLVYQIMLWIKNTRAWMLLKGIVVLGVFILLAYIFNMNTILWIASKTINVAIIAVVIVFQPELRKALEQLGRRNFLSAIFAFDNSKEGTERFSDRTVNEIVKAVYEMSKVKTGALIVVEQNIMLNEYERTGIQLDSLLSSQLLINIFEHNTPLHDGAIIVRGNRIVSATCYLPLSDSMSLGKELGTRHRAAVGISEATDSLTIVVSEETGKVSIAIGGELIRNIEAEVLKKYLVSIQNKSMDFKRFRLWRGRAKNEKNADK